MHNFIYGKQSLSGKREYSYVNWIFTEEPWNSIGTLHQDAKIINGQKMYEMCEDIELIMSLKIELTS